MIQYAKDSTDILPLFSYQISQYMIKSLLFRKKGKLDRADNSAMITWGPSLIIGGEFSDTISEALKSKLQNNRGPYWIYSPEGEWKSFVEATFAGHLEEKQVNLYKYDESNVTNYQPENSYIVQVTGEWLQSGLSSTIKNEIYSYTSIDDFLQNGFGLALVINNKLCGYCLSEYGIDNECAISIWVDEEYRRLGYAKKMTQLFMHHGMNKNWSVFWGCEADNIPSNKLAKLTGFTFSSSLKYYEWTK